MRTRQWTMGVLLAAVLAGATGCGQDEVTVRPTGGSSSGSACVTDGAGSKVCADGTGDGAGTATAGNQAGSEPGSEPGSEQGAGISLGKDGASLSDGQGGSISLGPNGASLSDGQGNGISLGQDGASVSAGGSASTGGTASSGGTAGTVELGGALSWRGPVSGGCNQMGAETRVIAAQLPQEGLLQIQIYNADTASVSLVQGDRQWGADFLGNGARFITVRDGSTQLRGVRLNGEAGTVDLTATFDC